MIIPLLNGKECYPHQKYDLKSTLKLEGKSTNEVMTNALIFDGVHFYYLVALIWTLCQL